MQYTRLGSTGLSVSRICLGMMTYGSPQWRPWVLDEAASRPLVRHAVEQGINFFDTADMYSGGESEVLTGKFLREFCQRDEVVLATKVFFPVDLAFKGGTGAAVTRVPTAAGCRASASSTPSTRACRAWAPTTSTCTRSTAGIRSRPSRRRWRRCTTS